MRQNHIFAFWINCCLFPCTLIKKTITFVSFQLNCFFPFVFFSILWTHSIIIFIFRYFIFFVVCSSLYLFIHLNSIDKRTFYDFHSNFSKRILNLNLNLMNINIINNDRDVSSVYMQVEFVRFLFIICRLLYAYTLCLFL